MMKRLRNPHLPGIADVIEQGDSLLIVMDYVEGRSLEALLQESGAQPVESVLAWAIQLCQVLTYLHSQSPPVIYRDLKPSNVMLKPDGKIVLIDLGAAREYKPGTRRIRWRWEPGATRLRSSTRSGDRATRGPISTAWVY